MLEVLDLGPILLVQIVKRVELVEEIASVE